MEFTKYASLENTYRTATIQKVIQEGLHDGAYVVTEKVHGANYTLQSDGETVVACRRTGIIPQGEKFYNHLPVFEKYASSVLVMVKDNFPLSVVRVVGELYGKGVQKEIVYKDEQDFIVFDIFVDNVPLPNYNVTMLCEDYNIPKVPTIFLGSFEEALLVNNGFETLLSFITDPTNIMEGVVIKPVTPKFFKNGSMVIFKNKNSKFSEKKQKSGEGIKKVLTPLPEDAILLLNTLLEYITSNRVNNVISKIGNITNKDFGKIQGLFLQDVLEDYNKDIGVTIDKSLWKMIQKPLSTEAAKVVRTVFTQMV